MKRQTINVLSAIVGFLIGSFLIAMFSPAHAKPVAEVPERIVLTDERGKCPRMHRVAIRGDFVRGCWTMDEISRAITIVWEDNEVSRYTEMQLEIYGRIL